MTAPLIGRRFAAALFLTLLSWSLSGALQPAVAEIDGAVATEIHDQLHQMGQSLKLERMSAADLAAAMDQVMALRDRAGQCRQAAQAALDQATQAETALGKPEPHENAELAKTRQSIADYKAKAANSLAECRLDVVIADILAGRIDDKQKTLLARHLTRSGDNLLVLARENLAAPGPWVQALLGVTAGAGDRATLLRGIVLLLAAAAAGIAIGRWAGRYVRARVRLMASERFADRAMHGLAGSFARYATPWAAFGAVAGGFWAGGVTAAGGTVAAVATGASGFMTAKIVLYGLLSPPAPARQVTDLPDPLARSFARRLSVVSAVIALGLVLALDPVQDALPRDAYDFGRAIFVTVLVVNLAWLTWLVGRVPRFQQTGRALRLVLLAALAGIVAAEWLGYRNLSGYLLQGLLETLVVGALLWALNALINEVCAGLDGADASWAARLRRGIGLGAGEGFPGLVWLRLLMMGVLAAAAGFLLLQAWGLSNAGRSLIVGYLVDGFPVGDIRVVPAKVLTGIVFFAVLLAITRWLKSWAETKWLARSQMDRGAKDTAVAMVGYCGFVLATLVGLSVAGVSLANLAIIASALSVGIGFGLQNIVSNFVSGLILLFERPIKTGDWVVVGSTEGYVKRIRVRATEIRTFEQSDVTVPNSDLITGHVKNWTLRDHLGQAVVPISVGLGADTELVRRLLLEIAAAHRGIVSDRRYQPKVLFRSFGDAALNFELHFIVHNVEERLDVISDVNFAIDKSFREHGLRG
jgi:potassium efflux system protein